MHFKDILFYHNYSKREFYLKIISFYQRVKLYLNTLNRIFECLVFFKQRFSASGIFVVQKPVVIFHFF